MKTFMPKEADIQRKWYLIDAEGLVLGRLASQVAMILRGKNKPTYTPNADTGDYVVVINADKMVLTGKKLDQKLYRHHTGYAGHMKEMQYKDLMAQDIGVICLYYILEIYLLGYYGGIGEVAEVAAVTLLVQERRIFRAREAAGGEGVVALHIGMPVHAEWAVGATPEACHRAFEVAHRGVKIHRFHRGEVGRRRHRQRVACGMVVAGARHHFQLQLPLVLKPTLAAYHHRQLAEGHSVDYRYRQRPHARFQAHIQNGSVNIHSVGVGAVEYHHRFVLIGAGAHHIEYLQIHH